MTDNIKNNSNQDSNTDDNYGINILIRNNLCPISELPGLKIVLDKFAKLTAADLFISVSKADNLIEITNISYLNFGDYINNKINSTIAVIIKIEEIDEYFVISLDRKFTDFIIELLLGGGGVNSLSQKESKSYTEIEKKIAEYVFNIIIKNLELAFSAVKKVTLKIEQLIELRPNLSLVFQLSDVIMLVEIEVGESQKGLLELIFPVSLLESIINVLHKPFLMANVKKSHEWYKYFSDILNDVELEIKVILGYCNIGVDDVLNLKIDDVLNLQSATSVTDEVLVTVNNEEVFTGKSGSIDEKLGVEINKVLKVVSKNKG